VIAKLSQRDIVLAGSVATESDKLAAGALVADLSGVKSVTNQISVGSRAPAPEPELTHYAPLSMRLAWTGTALTISGDVPDVLAADLDRKVLVAFDTDSITIERRFTTTEGAAPVRASATVAAALQALALCRQGTAKVAASGFELRATVVDAATLAKVKELVERAGGTAELTIKDANPAPAADAGPTPDVVVAEVAVAEVAVDAGPADAVASNDAAATQPERGGALTPAECKSIIDAMIEGDKRIMFRSNTGKLTDEGEATVKAVADVLARCPTATGSIEGYHDDYGDPDKLKELTQIRAFNVHKRLADHGIDKSRFRYIGYGYRNMRYGGKPGMRVLNQRVEINITVE